MNLPIVGDQLGYLQAQLPQLTVQQEQALSQLGGRKTKSLLNLPAGHERPLSAGKGLARSRFELRSGQKRVPAGIILWNDSCKSCAAFPPLDLIRRFLSI